MNLPAIRSYAALVPWMPPTPARHVVDAADSGEPVQVLDARQSGADSAPPPSFEPGGRTLGRFIDTWA